MRVSPGPIYRDSIYGSSLTFFLPSDWIDDPTLRLRAELNPFHFPPEPYYSDNTLTTSTFSMAVSGRLETHFVLFEYESGGARFRPRYEEDFLQTVSWVRRTYPLATDFGWQDDPDPGFRPGFRHLFHSSLGDYVDGTYWTLRYCHALDSLTLCAPSFVVCPALDTIRATDGLPNTIFQIGMVSNDAGHTRSLLCAHNSASISSGSGWTPDWDLDGSSADWQTGHYLGLSLQRQTPVSGNECGHSPDDPGYPWPRAEIGDNSYRGFDIGIFGSWLAGLAVNFPTVYPNEWHDMMSYCGPPGKWISDYTYLGIKDFIGTAVPALQAPDSVSGGAYLQLSGVLIPANHAADMTQVRLWDSLGFVPTAPTPGDYRIRLLNGGGSELAHYDFTPFEGEITSALLISEFVPFIPGTARVEITHPDSGDLAWSYDISTNAPAVSSVQLLGTPSPVSGMVTLQWTASDADDDDLIYDVLYSKDDGATWQMIQMALTDTETEIDTAELAGSIQGRFKVIANDGLNQGEAMSAAYDMAMKAPTITVISPADGQTFVFGEEVYFAAEVYDLQDGDVATILWRDQTNFVLGTGTEFSQDDLIIGENIVTVRATNSAGLSTQATFTIYVDDELEPPAATLTVGPDQAGWHVGEGELALQTTTVSVNNLGEGEFTVNVVENAPWLSVSQSGNTTPLQLTLTADPSYLQSGNTLTASLEIVGTLGTATQMVVVPVSFSMGYIVGPGGVGESRMIFLPVALKP